MTQAIPDLIEEFLVAAAARGLAYKTREEAYGVPLRRIFAPWCQEQGIAAGEQLTTEVLAKFAIAVNGRRKHNGELISQNSARTYLKSLNQFLSWLRTERGIDAKAGRLPRRRRKAIDPLTDSDLAKLQQAARSERDRLILGIMATTGAREGEVANLRTTDLILRDRKHYLRFDGKTGERICPLIDADLVRRLQTYIRTGRGRGVSSDRMFTSLRKSPNGQREALTTTGLYRMVKATAGEADLGKRVYPHLFRHTAVTAMLRGGVNPITVSNVTGVGLNVIADVYSHLGHEDHWDALNRARKSGDVRHEVEG